MTAGLAPDHDHDHDEPRALRAEALEALLIERGVVAASTIDRILDYFEEMGPQHGARVIARAWQDDVFRLRLLHDGTATVRSMGIKGPEIDHLVVLENTDHVHNVVVCTLCSCYPWAVLGLPPAWYKSLEYRARVVRDPRAVLAEFGCELADDIEIRVWDSSAETRYLVLPQRPPDTQHLGLDDLAALVRRDHMIGVAR